jgi:hypothetical protein
MVAMCFKDEILSFPQGCGKSCGLLKCVKKYT